MSYQNKIKYPKNENEVSSDVNFKIEDMSDDKYFVAKMPILDEMESGNYSPVNVDETMSLEFDDDTNILDREKLELEKKKDEYYRKLISQYNESSKDKLDKDSENMEIIDDFIRNFLIRGDFKKTFQCFQTEWFEKNLKNPEESKMLLDDTVPNVYTQNLKLQMELSRLEDEKEVYKNAAVKINELYTKYRKECLFHKTKHKRIIQEKNALKLKLVSQIEKNVLLEPKISQINTRYNSSMREKMMIQIELDKSKEKIIGLESALKSIGSFRNTTISYDKDNTIEDKEKNENIKTEIKHAKDSKFPIDHGTNLKLIRVQKMPNIIRSGGFRQTHQIKEAHVKAISGLALHPTKDVIASGGDDGIWKLWSLTNCELVMEGKGHKEWISSCDFHPSGMYLATSSGDSLIKIWDFKTVECITSFKEHLSVVWDVSWHSCGDFIASASMDKKIKIWDAQSLRCRNTLRGHSGSVNSINFLYGSNCLVSSSADKTISLWDARTNFCSNTFYGHEHSVNDANFNLKGTSIASCDSYGNVKIWDVRNLDSIETIEFGPHSTNSVTFDPTGQIIVAASDDASVKMYDLMNCKVSNLMGHSDAVQRAIFDLDGKFVISSGSDQNIKIWS